MTQMLKARAGKITEEIAMVAQAEGVTPEFVRDRPRAHCHPQEQIPQPL